MTPPFLQKAETGLKGARALRDLGDKDGACSRAYYAMYDAARACLAWAGVEPVRGGVQDASRSDSGVFHASREAGYLPGRDRQGSPERPIPAPCRRL
ncbi:MAG: HEPN domain-containing protein [Rhodospirillales bacterium]|nr:HEPN domain-containing protein [Rhodospirillales bacterium]